MKTKQLPYGYWLDRHGKLYPVEKEGGHADIAIDLLGDRFLYVLELGWVRVVNTKKTIFFEYGNTTRPSMTQIKVLKNLALDHDRNLISDNTGREIDLFESKVMRLVAESLAKAPSGTERWRDRYPGLKKV